MRVFYLCITAADCNHTDDTTWQSIAVNLYDNGWYRNFSTIKSQYGTNLLGTNVWTGIGSGGGTVTANQRFVDKTGRIDIVNYVVLQDDIVHAGGGNVDVALDVYTSPFFGIFPEEWTGQLGLRQQSEINIAQSDPLAIFVLHLTPPLNDTIQDFKLYVRIEINEPDMAPFYRRTRAMLDKFPEWMALREIENSNPSVVDTPTSRGGKFLNAVAGEWLDDLFTNLTYLQLQHYIDTVDTTQLAWAYQSVQVPAFIYRVVGDGYPLAQAVDIKEFKEALPSEPIYWWDENNDNLYTNVPFGTLAINDIPYPQTPHQVWNSLDDIGILVDLFRITLESNDQFRLRILDVYKNPPGVGRDQFKLALRRELSLWGYFGSGPDSNFPGATPEVLELDQIEKDPFYVDPDGMPTVRFTNLVEYLANQYPTTWGRFYWGKAIWDVGGDNYTGFTVLPYRMDQQALDNAHTESGIGDGDDLFVFRPDVVGGLHQFHAQLKVRGRQKSYATQYPPVTFNVNIFGEADILAFNNPPLVLWLTVELTPAKSQNVYYYSFQTTTTSDIAGSGMDPTTGSHTVVDIFDPTTGQTLDSIIWSDRNTGVTYNDPSATPINPTNAFTIADIDTLVLRAGYWDYSSQTYRGTESQDDFEAWFSIDTSTVLRYNTTSGFPTIANVPLAGQPAVVVASLLTASSLTRWQSEKTNYQITVNGAGPDLVQQDFILALPPIHWANNLENPPNKQYVVEVFSTSQNAYGGFTEDADGNTVFLNYSNILVNDSAGWTGGAPPQLRFDLGTQTVTFAVNYTINGYIWEYFENLQLTSFSGQVDENGPLRNDQPANFGNNNFALRNFNLTRAEFGVPDSADYVLTWMGVDVLDDQQVLVWLDTNTIKPAIDPATNLSYPDNAIRESIDQFGNYSFGSVTVRARLRPDPAPPWYPSVHSGYFYDRQSEYYLYANPNTVLDSGATPTKLPGVAWQGAPIIVTLPTAAATPRELREVFFADTSATPISHTLQNVEHLSGNNTPILYLAYPDVYAAVVRDLTSGHNIACVPNMTTNELLVEAVTDPDHTYEVRYIVNGSFYADHDAVNDATPPQQVTQLVFDQPAFAWPDASTPWYSITYESSQFNPATPMSVPLNPLYSTINEGFLYISFNEYTLDSAEIRVNPSSIVADGNDYILISVRSLDANRNPKPYQVFHLTTSWGRLETTQLTTDQDGFATVALHADLSTNSLTGILTVSGTVSATVKFDINPVESFDHRVIAVPASDELPADGMSKNLVYGRVEDEAFNPISYAYVRWVRGRSLHDVFTFVEALGGEVATLGAGTMGLGLMGGGSGGFVGITTQSSVHDFDTVVTDGRGIFSAGPFNTATPDSTGYWFVMMESNQASPTGTGQWTPVGDVVTWYEYPDHSYSVENLSGLPLPPVQMAIPSAAAVPYSKNPQYPVSYFEADTTIAATPAALNWLPSRWYALNMYDQYQLGLLGATPNALDINYLSHLHPPTKEL